MTLTSDERRLCRTVDRRRADLVALATELIAFNTSAPAAPGAPARDEAALQIHLARRLRAVGASVDLWEPDDGRLAPHPWFPSGHTMAGRPQLCARFPGAGGGPALMLNGHVDVVPAEPGAWTTDPWRAEVRDGVLYGRGACDMKGPIAALVVAAEAVADAGGLAGDLLVVTNTDEESTGAGALAVVDRGIRADAGIVAEPTGFDAWVACRGVEFATVTITGRPGHIEGPPEGAVSAIDGGRAILDALERLDVEWRSDPTRTHPLLGPSRLVATGIRGGEWLVSTPASCAIDVAVLYAPALADRSGGGGSVRAAVERRLARDVAADGRARGCTVSVSWSDVPARPADVPADTAVATGVLAAGRDVGRPGRASAGAWHDGATYIREGSFPVVAFGPPGLGGSGASAAHAVDEHVPVEDLVRCAQALAVTALRFCGHPGQPPDANRRVA